METQFETQFEIDMIATGNFNSLELYNLVTNILDGTEYGVSYAYTQLQLNSIVIYKKGTSRSIRWIIEDFTVNNIVNLKNCNLFISEYDINDLKHLLNPLSRHIVKKAHMFNI